MHHCRPPPGCRPGSKSRSSRTSRWFCSVRCALFTNLLLPIRPPPAAAAAATAGGSGQQPPATVAPTDLDFGSSFCLLNSPTLGTTSSRAALPSFSPHTHTHTTVVH